MMLNVFRDPVNNNWLEPSTSYYCKFCPQTQNLKMLKVTNFGNLTEKKEQTSETEPKREDYSIRKKMFEPNLTFTHRNIDKLVMLIICNIKYCT